MSLMTNRVLRQAIEEWDREVEAEMLILIKRGVPPYDAAVKARDTISRRRREASPYTGDNGALPA